MFFSATEQKRKPKNRNKIGFFKNDNKLPEVNIYQTFYTVALFKVMQRLWL